MSCQSVVSGTLVFNPYLIENSVKNRRMIYIIHFIKLQCSSQEKWMYERKLVMQKSALFAPENITLFPKSKNIATYQIKGNFIS